MRSAVFYSVGRRFSEALSMGYVIFRGALEGILYVISAFIVLVTWRWAHENGPSESPGPYVPASTRF